MFKIAGKPEWIASVPTDQVETRYLSLPLHETSNPILDPNDDFILGPVVLEVKDRLNISTSLYNQLEDFGEKTLIDEEETETKSNDVIKYILTDGYTNVLAVTMQPLEYLKIGTKVSVQETVVHRGVWLLQSCNMKVLKDGQIVDEKEKFRKLLGME